MAKAKSSADRLMKEAISVTAAGIGEGTAFPTDASAARTPLLYLDPLFDQILIMFPQDNLRELYRRLRHYYKYDPYVRTIIDYHTETPISDFELRCPNILRHKTITTILRIGRICLICVPIPYAIIGC